jgi:hypothetical protein
MNFNNLPDLPALSCDLSTWPWSKQDFQRIPKEELRATVGEMRDTLTMVNSIVGHLQEENGEEVLDKDKLIKLYQQPLKSQKLWEHVISRWLEILTTASHKE